MTARGLYQAVTGRRDRGATIIEVALVAPTLFLILIALFEMGLVVIGNSEASNAVREGARIGIIQFEDADVPGSTNRQVIEDAVEALLPGTVDVDSVTIDVRCARPGPSSFSAVACDPEVVELRSDVIEVTVRWDHLLATPFVSSMEHVKVARMALVGEPDLSPTSPPAPPTTTTTTTSSTTTTSIPGATTSTTAATTTTTEACVVSVSLDSTSYALQGNSGKLTSDVRGTVSTNGSAACDPVTDLDVYWATQASPPTYFGPVAPQGDGRFTIPGSDKTWSAGQWFVEARQGGSIMTTLTFTVS